MKWAFAQPICYIDVAISSLHQENAGGLQRQPLFLEAILEAVREVFGLVNGLDQTMQQRVAVAITDLDSMRICVKIIYLMLKRVVVLRSRQ